MPLSTVIIRISILLLILTLLDIYTFSGLKALTADVATDKSKKLIYWIYWVITISYFILFIATILSFNGNTGPRGGLFKIASILLVLIWLPKIVFCLFLLLEDVYRLVGAVTVFVFDKTGMEPRGANPLMEERRKVVSQIALGIASIPFFSIIYGVTKGKYNYVVREVSLKFKDLPKSFDGLTITQISDIHSGSFDNEDEVKKGLI